MPTILRLPLLQLAALVFDCEVSVGRSGERELSERRLAAGATVVDHSRRPPRTFTVEGSVSAVAQPQNLVRPNASPADIGTQAGLDLAGAFVPLFLMTRVQDFEARLDALLDDSQFREIELISKVVGRVTVVLLRWEATTRPDDGRSATYRLTLREVQRQVGLTITQATEASLALVGTGGAPQPGGGGPSQSTPMTLDVTP